MAGRSFWLRTLLCVVWVCALAACNNNPMPSGLDASNTAVSAMVEGSPRHLDPVASYWSNDTPFTYQIYEPPYGYHYLLRPFQLRPKAAVEVVKPTYLDAQGHVLPDDTPGSQVAESVYDIRIKPGILFQPHPAFARDEQGRYRYHAMKPGDVGARRTPGCISPVKSGAPLWSRVTADDDKEKLIFVSLIDRFCRSLGRSVNRRL